MQPYIYSRKKEVSIRAPTRGAITNTDTLLVFIIVSIHVPTRGAIAKSWRNHPGHRISIHTPTRRAIIVGHALLTKSWFQSTLPRGERYAAESTWEMLKQFQSTPHAGAIPVRQLIFSVFADSIHAPTRGAICTGCQVSPVHPCFNPHSHRRSDNSTIGHTISRHCFNPRPTRGAVCLSLPPFRLCGYFNPHSHTGSDPQLKTFDLFRL